MACGAPTRPRPVDGSPLPSALPASTHAGREAALGGDQQMSMREHVIIGYRVSDPVDDVHNDRPGVAHGASAGRGFAFRASVAASSYRKERLARRGCIA